ncbi:uncharacterized protein LOC123014463 [Tribolium madens]|uniref:uncharacterized protein LOC123014463 n=1 Tax=Tribolium madens TaxID=41895 RepID=UPI001CF73103|nr:uncharacterized protein LOC123014463 [Tribolium madens]
MNFRAKKTPSPETIDITFIKHDDSFSWPSPTSDELEESPVITPNCSTCSLDMNFDKNSVISELSSVSSLDGPIEDIYCKRRSSRLRISNRARIEPSILNHVLDFLSTCFWKCSTGCQQLPDKHF